MLGEKPEIMRRNVGRLLGALRDVPSDGHYVHVDDALLAAGILQPRTIPMPKPLDGENT